MYDTPDGMRGRSQQSQHPIAQLVPGLLRPGGVRKAPQVRAHRHRRRVEQQPLTEALGSALKDAGGMRG